MFYKRDLFHESRVKGFFFPPVDSSPFCMYLVLFQAQGVKLPPGRVALSSQA